MADRVKRPILLHLVKFHDEISASLTGEALCKLQSMLTAIFGDGVGLSNHAGSLITVM